MIQWVTLGAQLVICVVLGAHYALAVQNYRRAKEILKMAETVEAQAKTIAFLVNWMHVLEGRLARLEKFSQPNSGAGEKGEGNVAI